MKPAILLLALTSIALAQGPIDPPGPPGLTMRSLDEINPRIPLNQPNTPGDATCVFKITQPGSYILTGNLKPPSGHHGILVALMVPGVVVVDLMGFTIDGSNAGAGASAVVCYNEVLLDDMLRFHNGTVSNFAGTSCLDASATAGAMDLNDLYIHGGGAGVSTSGRLVMNNVSISGSSGIPVQMGSDSVLESVSIKYAGSSPSIVCTGTGYKLSDILISSVLGGGTLTNAMLLGPDTQINGMSLRLSDATFTGPVLANSSGFSEVSGLSVELNNVTAPCVCNSFSFGASQAGIVSPRDAASGQATGKRQHHRIRANNCTLTEAAIILDPSLTSLYPGYEEIDIDFIGTTTVPTGVRVEADNYRSSYEIFMAATATVSGAVIDVAASGTTTSANIRGGNVGVRISSGTGNTVEGCSFIGLFVPAAAIQISAGVTSSLVRNNRAARLPAGGVLVQNNGGSTNLIAPVLTNQAQLTGNNNPFANIVH